MFEYLMPTLFIKNYAGPSLDSCYAALDAQIIYGKEKQVPWGISESGYFAFDVNLNYQYRAFGVPDLGYKRDLPDDLVITPYAALLGLFAGSHRLWWEHGPPGAGEHARAFWLYEALDYTKTHLPAGQTHAIVNPICTPPGHDPDGSL